MVASEMREDPTTEGGDVNLYDNESDLQKVTELERTLSLVELEEREAKLKRADEKIASSKIVGRKDGKNLRTGIRKDVLTSEREEDVLGEDRNLRVENAIAKASKSQAPTKSSAVSARHYITSNVLGTGQDSGISDKPLDESLQAKIKRAANVTAKAVGSPVTKSRAVRSNIVSNLMKSLSRDKLFSEQSSESESARREQSIKKRMTMKMQATSPAADAGNVEEGDKFDLEEKMRQAAKRQVRSKPVKGKVAPAAAPPPVMKRRQSIRSTLV